MAKGIFSIQPGGRRRVVGISALGRHGQGRGSPRQQVHDGDTINVDVQGNLAVRFLGIDTPEVSFSLPGSGSFTRISNQKWVDYLCDPLGQVPGLADTLGPGLADYLHPRLGPETAQNHARHADRVEDILENMIQADMDELGKTKDDFQFFHSFSHDVMDTYGRLLCYTNREQPEPPRPRSYNERMLEQGATSPYFIWPNVNPFRPLTSRIDAVPTPGKIVSEVSENGSGLRDARRWVREARTAAAEGTIFAEGYELLLEPFELRFLARQDLPTRWVIDLSRDSDTLLLPQHYYRIPRIEDRLFIPVEYVPLFRERGWKTEALPKQRQSRWS